VVNLDCIAEESIILDGRRKNTITNILAGAGFAMDTAAGQQAATEEIAPESAAATAQACFPRVTRCLDVRAGA
jgi:hypothetical protein